MEAEIQEWRMLQEIKVKLLKSHEVRDSVIGRRCGFGRDCPGLADWPWRLDGYRE